MSVLFRSVIAGNGFYNGDDQWTERAEAYNRSLRNMNVGRFADGVLVSWGDTSIENEIGNGIDNADDG